MPGTKPQSKKITTTAKQKITQKTNKNTNKNKVTNEYEKVKTLNDILNLDEKNYSKIVIGINKETKSIVMYHTNTTYSVLLSGATQWLIRIFEKLISQTKDEQNSSQEINKALDDIANILNGMKKD